MLVTSSRTSKTSRSRQTIDALPLLLDKYVGLIHSIKWHETTLNDPQIFYCNARIADVSRITGWEANELGGGTALTVDEALAKAIGESVERYCADMYAPEEIAIATLGEIAEWSIDPRRCALFHSEQYSAPHFPFTPLLENTKLVWAPAFSLTRNESLWMPLSLITAQHQWKDQEEQFDLSPVSGYACGRSLEDALLRGICEVIERDAFMLHWYNRLPAPVVDMGDLQHLRLRQTLDCFRCSPVQIHCCDITTEVGIPTHLAMMLGRDPSWPALVIATATDLDPMRSLERALLELAANYLFVRSLLSREPLPRKPSEVRTQEDHALFYTDYRLIPQISHLFSGKLVKPSLNSATKTIVDVASLVKHLAQFEFEVIYVDLTTKDIEDLGFKVVKVAIPGMQPIDFGPIVKHLGSPRLYEAPLRMGHKIAHTHPKQLNHFPHPFP
jgi:ribosomal protein S12 methylthiotransferase accessory factor